MLSLQAFMLSKEALFLSKTYFIPECFRKLSVDSSVRSRSEGIGNGQESEKSGNDFHYGIYLFLVCLYKCDVKEFMNIDVCVTKHDSVHPDAINRGAIESLKRVFSKRYPFLVSSPHRSNKCYSYSVFFLCQKPSVWHTTRIERFHSSCRLTVGVIPTYYARVVYIIIIRMI